MSTVRWARSWWCMMTRLSAITLSKMTVRRRVPTTESRVWTMSWLTCVCHCCTHFYSAWFSNQYFTAFRLLKINTPHRTLCRDSPGVPSSRSSSGAGPIWWDQMSTSAKSISTGSKFTFSPFSHQQGIPAWNRIDVRKAITDTLYSGTALEIEIAYHRKSLT